jgi:hypothetical protein
MSAWMDIRSWVFPGDCRIKLRGSPDGVQEWFWDQGECEAEEGEEGIERERKRGSPRNPMMHTP